MTTGTPQIVVLGAGITGLTAAYELSKAFKGTVVLLEHAAIGGLAATFTHGSFAFDLGSHRLHEGHDRDVDALIRDLCGADLVRRERRGLIYLKDRVLRYPPSSIDLTCAFGVADFLRFTSDFALARVSRCVRSREPADFETFAIGQVGKSLYDRFYKPYAVKLYGLSPREISKEPAVSRVRKFTIASLWRDVQQTFLRKRATYLYPTHGIGQLSTTLRQRFLDNGGRMAHISSIERLSVTNGRTIQAIDCTMRDGTADTLQTDLLVSTIPLDALYRLVASATDNSAAFDLRWRGLRLLYLITGDHIPSEHETHYFPESHIIFGRVSELNKYSPSLNQDPDRAVLTIEIPCTYDDDTWRMPDGRLAAQCIETLQGLGLLRTGATSAAEFFSVKLRHVYPVYDLGWRERFDAVLQRLDAIDNLYMIGRAALFLHCNIDHCMSMAIRLSKHLAAGNMHKRGWSSIQRGFLDYRVHE